MVATVEGGGVLFTSAVLLKLYIGYTPGGAKLITILVTLCDLQ